ncbi:MAG TPA: M55 family metallopeptidase, partial [Steroidobacteraceae bacterium]|nr:M55 family metallopeptidase [Steroidobacteraceae bacterium]
MMAGLDGSFAAALFVGYHASTTNPKGVRAHTFSSAHYTRVALNGVAVTEGEFNAAYAGDLGVPVVFASGDDAALAELRSRLGNLDTVTTKRALGFHSAETLTPAAACDQIYQGALAALTRSTPRRPFRVSHPVTLDLTFKSYLPAEILSYLRSVERTDSHSIRFTGRDMAEVADFLEVIEWYGPDLAP